MYFVLEDNWKQGGFGVVSEVGGAGVAHQAPTSTGALKSGPGETKERTRDFHLWIRHV